MPKDDVNEKLIQLINAGNEIAFSVFYDSYYVYLNAIAFYYVNNEDVSREIVNDVFMKVWEKRASLMYPVNTYMVRMVQNLCIDHIRSQSAQQRAHENHKDRLTLSYQEQYIQSTPQPLEYLELNETEREIKKAIQQLTPRCRQIFNAYFNEGKSVEEIAKELDITISTVRVQMKNSYEKLRTLLQHLLFLVF